jgi:hypothetical protein
LEGECPIWSPLFSFLEEVEDEERNPDVNREGTKGDEVAPIMTRIAICITRPKRKGIKWMVAPIKYTSQQK